MIALVLVGHSHDLVSGLAAMVRQSAPGVPVTIAGGTDLGALGTSTPAVLAALGAALDGSAGAVVLLDLNSAALAVEMALEDLPAEMRAGVRVSRGPLVEGALAGAIECAAGGSLAEVLAATQDTAAFAAGKLPPDWPADGGAPAPLG